MDHIYLHLGCGNRLLPGFINIDMGPGADMQLDLTQPLPWAANTVTGIYSEHFIEHLSQAQGITLLHECRRVLLPGGVVRIATPDLEEVVADYMANRAHPDFARFGMDWTATRCERMNMSMRWWGHQWVYDAEELTRLATMVGLRLKGRHGLGESPDPMLRNLEYRAASGLVLEFEKPARRLAPGAAPLVSVAIPAYNPRFFGQALKSAMDQTYRNLDILVCDDCAGTEIEDMTREQAKADPRIRYLRNPPETARKEYGRENYLACFRESAGDFLKFLNDDDLLAPNCVEKLLSGFALAEDIVLVTSKRQQIDSEGNPLPDILSSQALVGTDAILEGRSLGTRVVQEGCNYVGEPTTVLFRKSDMAEVRPDPMSMDGKKLIGVSDVAMWLNLLAKGDAIYFVEPVSSFRRHEQQVANVAQSMIQDHSIPGWRVIQAAWQRLGLLRT